MKNESERRKNLLPKMLYFNKFLNIDEKVYKPIERKENLNQSNITNPVKIQSTEGKDTYKEIESAIMAKNIEDNSRSHIKKTIRKFDDLLKYVDTFKFKNKSKSSSKFLLNEDEKNKLNIVLNSEGNNENEDNNDEEDEDILKTENYNFDEFRNQFKKSKFSQKDEGGIITPLKTYNSQVILQKRSPDTFKKINDNIYITKVNKNPDNNSQSNIPNILDLKDISNIIESNNYNIMTQSNDLKINNMNLISDDSLVNKIKNEGRDYKNGLYFNNYGKYKFTDLGLSYPEFVDKYKSKKHIYFGTEFCEKKLFALKDLKLIASKKYEQQITLVFPYLTQVYFDKVKDMIDNPDMKATLVKVMNASSPEEILAIAKEDGIALTPEQAETIFAGKKSDATVDAATLDKVKGIL